MNKLIITFAMLLMVSSASAQSRRSLKDIDRELKQTKSTATAMALIESIAETIPQTEEDVAVLGQLMDRFPVEGQKAITGIKDPKLAKALMKECDRQAIKLKAFRSKGEGNLTDKDRQDYLNGYMNSAATIDTLSKLNNKDAIPLLRGYLQNEDLSRFASVALGRLGDTQSLDGMLNNIGHGKAVDLAGYGDRGLVKVLEELDKPGMDTKRKDALIEQIKGSRSPERKRLLKDLALNHKDARVRDRAAGALLNSIIVNHEPEDDDFTTKWIAQTKNDETGYWAVTSIRVSHGNGDKPLSDTFIKTLVDVLRTSTYSPTRSEAAQTLGLFKVKESTPYLEECIVKDKESNIRGACQRAYWEITGKVPAKFYPADAAEQTERFKRPRTIEFYGRLSDKDPSKIFFLELKRAVEEFQRNQKQGE